jgi:hypothetical protein
MALQPRQTPAEAIRDIRVNLQFQAEYLRRFDQETTEKIAKRLDRLRWNLKPYAQEKSS